jgi:hypothetical protein
MAPAWASCMRWALGNDDVRAAFESATAHRYVPPKNGLEQMIDEVSGQGTAYVKAFVLWANEHVWGAMDNG